MKKIPIKAIKSKGLKLELNAAEDWVMEVLNNVITDKSVDLKTVAGHIDLRIISQIVDINGEIKFTRHPLCSRCGKTLAVQENIPIHANLAPLFTSPNERKKHKDEEEERELTKEDTDFSFYENDEIRVDTILHDDIALAQPYNFYCPKDEHCEAPKPTDPHVTHNEKIDPRWQPLKDLKSLKK